MTPFKGGTTILCGIEFALAPTPNGLGIFIAAGELLARLVWFGVMKSGTEPSSDDKADVEMELETGRLGVGLDGDENGLEEGVSVLVG
jgi:hypothetical protein